MKRFTLIAGAVCALTIGCATTGGIKSAPLTDGTVRFYNADLQRAVNATREAMIGASLGIESVDQVSKDSWMLVGKKAVSGFSWGELVRAVVQQDAQQGGVAVRIITQRRSAINVTARGDWSQQILSQLDLTLGAGRDSVVVKH